MPIPPKTLFACDGEIGDRATPADEFSTHLREVPAIPDRRSNTSTPTVPGKEPTWI
jgi:hypothetical protein